MLRFQEMSALGRIGAANQNKTMSESIDYLLSRTPHWFHDLVLYDFFCIVLLIHSRRNYSHGVAFTSEEVERNEQRMEKWINPLESRLPIAPHMRIYCL